MADLFVGMRLTETVVAGLRLAATRRSLGAPLDTHTVLRALQSVDESGDWNRFLIRKQPVPDSGRTTADTWDGVALSAECAEAFARARVISEAYGLEPMPAGVLALALVWDETSGAALSCTGLGPDEVVEQIQDDILGMSLEGLSEVLAVGLGVPGTDRGRPEQEDPRRPAPSPAIAPRQAEDDLHSSARTPAGDRPLRVCVVSSPIDRAATDAVLLELANLGVNAREHRGASGCQPDGASVLLLSQASLGNTAWLSAAAFHERGRVVPVRVAPFDDAIVPPFLADLNHITWRADHGEGVAAALRDALHSDVALLNKHRELAERAASWRRSSYAQGEELLRLRDARDARRHLRLAANDQFSRPTDLIRSFVAASTRDARKAFRLRLRKGIFRSVLVVLLTILSVLIVGQVRGATKQLRIATGATTPGLLRNRPDRDALNMLLLLPGAGFGMGAKHIIDAVDKPWRSATLGFTSPSSLVGGAISDDGKRALSLDESGVVSLWDVAHATTIWRRSFDAAGRKIAASPDLSTFVAAVGSRLEFVTDQPWKRLSVPLSSDVDALAWSPRENVAVVATLDHRILAVAPDGISRVVATPTSVMALTATSDGRVLALSRVSRDSIALMDARSGAALATAQLLSAPFETGAISPDGRGVAVSNMAVGVLAGGADLKLTPVGYREAPHMRHLSLLDDQTMVIVDDEHGAVVYDQDAGVVNQSVCTELTGISALMVTPSGNLVGCVSAGVLSLWNPQQLARIDKPKAAWITGDGGSRRGFTVKLIDDVTLRISGPAKNGGTATESLSLSPESDVAGWTSSGEFVVGSGDGRILLGEVTKLGVLPAYLMQIPTHSQVVRVGWDDNLRRIFAQTVDGLYWTVPACRGCWSSLTDGYVPAVTFPACYTADDMHLFDATFRKKFGVSVCGPLPRPVGG